METIDKKGSNKKIAIITGIIVALIIAIVAGTFMVQATPANKVKKQLQLAEKYLEKLDYDKALAAYNEAIKIDPRCEEAYLAMADIYIKTGDEEKAMEILEKGQENIQTDAMTEKLQEVKNYVASSGQSGQGGEVGQEKTTQAPTQATTEAATQAPTQTQAVVQAGNVGEIITLGRYEQDGDASNGAEPIEWLVLENQGDKMLVISKYGLDAKLYNTDSTGVTWETCTLRGWLNSEFLNMAFNDSEKEMIRTTLLENPDNSKLGTPGGNATNDKVFCLSIDEAERYFASDEERKTVPTQHAKNNGVHTYSNSGCCFWLLRSPGDDAIRAACVCRDGSVHYYGGYVYYVYNAVRPALWINL